ncbi:hypothetical protein KY343_05010 [Candidatus Woesearchaeota archaeon]|nr:hypothetical protein [Candidatus Woesearchaeota archaeon]
MDRIPRKQTSIKSLVEDKPKGYEAMARQKRRQEVYLMIKYREITSPSYINAYE